MMSNEDLEEIYLDDSEDSIKIDKSFKDLKEHQIEGVKFMWDRCFGNLEKIKNQDEGNGCILAHCMGLGKTLQVITLLHTLLTNRENTKVKCVLILCPVIVIHNWKLELKKWTRECKKKFDIYSLPNKRNKNNNIEQERLLTLGKWFETGGVFLMGFPMYKRLVRGQ